jgi:Flp pilus assembly protein TadG
MTLMLAALLLSQQNQQDPPAQPLPNGGQLITGVMARYNGANSLSATINSEVKYNQTTITFRTNLQYDKPNLFFLQQTKSMTGPRDQKSQNKLSSAFIVSDGKQVGYDDPDEARRLRGARSFEKAVLPDGTPFQLQHLYMIAKSCLLQESIPLDFLIADRDTLGQLKNRFETCKTMEKIDFHGTEAYHVEGNLNDFPVKGTYQLTVDAAGNLYEMKVIAPVSGTLEGGQVVSGTIYMSYVINAEVNGENDKAKYKVR